MQPNKSVEEIIHKLIQEQVASEVIYQDGFAEKKLLNCLVKLEKELVNFVTSHTNTVLQGVVERVLPFLKAYKTTLSSDWSLHPVQSQNAIYITPEQGLRNQADVIESKREMERKLDEVISLLNDQIISNEEKK